MSVTTRAVNPRLTRIRNLCDAVDGRGANTRPLSQVVADNLLHVYRTGGRRGADAEQGCTPNLIAVREEFVYTNYDDAHGPALPRLIASRGLQLKLYLLMLFDAQCRHRPLSPVKQVRTISGGQSYQPWRQLVLAETGTREAGGRLRERQIREAMVALHRDHHLLDIPLTAGGRRELSKAVLMSEDSNPDGAGGPYRVPPGGPVIWLLPQFFTNLWVFALSDTEIAVYLALEKRRQDFPMMSHVFITAGHREQNFRLTRATWLAIDRLWRYGLIEIIDEPRRDPATGTIEHFKDEYKKNTIAPTGFRINRDQLLKDPLTVITDALANPVQPDRGVFGFDPPRRGLWLEQ